MKFFKKNKQEKKQNNNVDEISEFLLTLPEIEEVTFEESVTSSVTTSWGVEWSEDYIARDIIQNFRDANKNNINKIIVNVQNNLVCISAPSSFDLRALFYVGTDKDKDSTNIGQYGEGFKAAVVSLQKMGVKYPVSISEDKACVISVGDSVGKGLDLKPLVYNFYTIKKIKGSRFFINSNNNELKNSFLDGLKNFWYPENPFLKEKLHEYNDISLYSSSEKDGLIFYSGIKRANIKDIPLIINIDKKYSAIEKKIADDRDRKFFNDRLTQSLYTIIFKSGFHYSTGTDNLAIQYIFANTSQFWKYGKGHPILKAIANNFDFFADSDRDYFRSIFADKFFSQSTFETSNGTYQEYHDLGPDIALEDRRLLRAKKLELPSYFTRLWVESSAQKLIKEKREKESKELVKEVFPPNRYQLSAIEFFFETLKKIVPEFSGLFTNVFLGTLRDQYGGFVKIDFKCIESEDLLGELKDSREYGSKVIYLNVKIFSGSFGKFFSVLVHELLHVFGKDGDRQFTDALTILIERVVDNYNVISEQSEEWQKYKIDQDIESEKDSIH